MRVLWFSNAVLEAADRGLSGTWLHAMAAGLVASGDVQLGNVTVGAARLPSRRDFGSVSQWITPSVRSVGRVGLPGASVVDVYRHAVEEFQPDLIHVWGAETFPGLITARGMVRHPALLEIQGLKGPLADVYAGRMSLADQLKSVGFKEILRGSTIPQQGRTYRQWDRFEREIIRGHRAICAPSPWMQSHVRSANPEALLFQNEIAIRREIRDAAAWKYSGAPIVFSSASYPAPFKGLHVLLRAMALLRDRIPDLRVRIAGALQATGVRQNGYVRWLNQLVRDLGLSAHVTWLGPIGAGDVARELESAAVGVFPSFAESYGAAHAEAMVVGTPCVLAFNGGSSYLAEHGKTGLFFPAGDHVACSDLVHQVMTGRPLAETLSSSARRVALSRHELDSIVERQIQIYGQLAAGGRREAQTR
jgi:glycosyltransferase involved in cell wall biosynthesis